MLPVLVPIGCRMPHGWRPAKTGGDHFPGSRLRISGEFADKGFVPMTLEVEGGETVFITISGQRNDVRLDRELSGRVGLLKWYDTAVRFKNWTWRETP